MPDVERLRVVVADDEPLARRVLRTLLARDPEVELIAECPDGARTLAAVRAEKPDLLLLDVQMPGKSGLDVLAELAPDERPIVLFVTAYDRYALDAFEFHAVDYLLKPFDDERFAGALGRAKHRARLERALAGRELDELLEAFAPRAEGEPPIERLVIRREGRVDVVDVGTIVWIEAADQYVVLHTDEGEHLMRESMSRLERSLDPAHFLRVHRSAIVALGRLKSLDRSEGSPRVRVADGTWLPVSRSRRAALEARLK